MHIRPRNKLTGAVARESTGSGQGACVRLPPPGITYSPSTFPSEAAVGANDGAAGGTVPELSPLLRLEPVCLGSAITPSGVEKNLEGERIVRDRRRAHCR